MQHVQIPGNAQELFWTGRRLALVSAALAGLKS